MAVKRGGVWENRLMQPKTYTATLGDLELRTWESDGRYPWSVSDSKTGNEIAQAEAADLVNAMIDAAQAAGAEWGAIKWRSSEEDSP